MSHKLFPSPFFVALSVLTVFAGIYIWNTVSWEAGSFVLLLAVGVVTIGGPGNAWPKWFTVFVGIIWTSGILMHMYYLVVYAEFVESEPMMSSITVFQVWMMTGMIYALSVKNSAGHTYDYFSVSWILSMLVALVTVFMNSIAVIVFGLMFAYGAAYHWIDFREAVKAIR